MDFLDPAKRRQHHTRLIIGYFLVSIAIFLTATVLVYWASGYGLNTKTGSVIENGLLFVDSKPGGASIYLNGQSYGATSARLNLASGSYDLVLKKAGYIDWEDKLTIAGQSVTRIVYPFLFPKTLNPQKLKNYANLPAVVTQSQDHHWLLVEQTDVAGGFTFDEYDTTKPTVAPISLALPNSLLSNMDKPNQALVAVGWASDNDHILLKHSYDGGLEFVDFDRKDPTLSVNLNRQFNVSPTDAALNNGRSDQIYLYDQAGSKLSLANISKNSLSAQLTHITDWQAVGDNLVFYITDQGAPSGQISFRIWDGNKSYDLINLPSAKDYQFDAAQYQSHWYYALGTDTTDRIIIYEDPLNSLKDSSVGRATPLISLVNQGSPKLSFSVNGRFIASQSGQHFNIYDTETETRYQYTLPKISSEILTWMDGNRLMGDVGGTDFVMDFDSENQHQLLPTAGGSVFFDGSFNHMYNFAPPAGDGTVNLQLTDLRAGTDLPKQ